MLVREIEGEPTISLANRPKESCVRWGPDSPWEGVILVDRGAHCKVYGLPVVSCAKAAEPIDLPFWLWTQVGRRMHKFNRIRQVVLMCPHWRTHCLHLANTTEPSVYGGDAPYVKLL